MFRTCERFQEERVVRVTAGDAVRQGSTILIRGAHLEQSLSWTCRLIHFDIVLRQAEYRGVDIIVDDTDCQVQLGRAVAI